MPVPLSAASFPTVDVVDSKLSRKATQESRSEEQVKQEAVCET